MPARGSPSAARAPRRLIGVILLGNTLANVAAASIVTLLTLASVGERWLWLSSSILTILLLLFSEVGPKTYGALNAEAWRCRRCS